jgi:hypothetical protein
VEASNDYEMCDFQFQSSGTWELVALEKSLVGCFWLYTVKVDGKIDRSKACLVAKGYTHIFGVRLL